MGKLSEAKGTFWQCLLRLPAGSLADKKARELLPASSGTYSNSERCGYRNAPFRHPSKAGVTSYRLNIRS